MRQQVMLGQLSSAGLLLTVSALFYGRIFEGPGWIGPVIGGVLLSAAIAVAIGRTSMTRPFRWLAAGLAGLLFLLLVVILPATDFAGPADIGSALLGATIDGWRSTLAATLPIDTSIPEPLGFATALAWVTGAVTGALVIRSDQPALPVVPPLVFAGLALPLGAPNGRVTFVLVVALLVSALLFALVRAVPRTASPTDADGVVHEFVGERILTERLLSGIPVLVALSVLAPLIALVLPGGPDEPFDPRRLRQEEVQTTEAVNPFAEIKAQRSANDPAFVLEIVGGVAATEFDRMGFAVLESYNGANWTSAATYSATSAELDAGPDPNVEFLEVRQRVELTGADRPWLPAGNRPVRIDADDVWYDEVSGTLLRRSDANDFGYEVVSRLARPTEDQLREAALDLSEAVFLELPTIPPDSSLNLLGDRLVGNTDFDRLQSLETALREDFRFLTDEPSGTSIGRLDSFLASGDGYRDQFVAAFAIAARQRGFPTRIVVGYRITELTEDDTNVFLDTVTSAEYDAWPEVRFEGIGWVPFDPVPATSGEGGNEGDDATSIPEGQAVSPGPTPSEAEPEEDDAPEEENQVVGTTVRVLIVSGLFLLFFPIMLLIVVFVAKAVRRRYREGLQDPTERVLAGWQESKDRLLEAGVGISRDMTIKEIVSVSRRDLGVHASSPLSTLAPFVTSTIYAPEPPTSEVADLVWSEVQLFDRQLNESRTRFQTVRAKVDPRPLIEST